MNNKAEKIWHEFHHKLKDFIRKRVSDDEAAQDLLQDVFLKIHSNIDTLRDEKKLNGWVYQITRNTIHDFYRRRKSIDNSSLEALVWEEPEAEESNAEILDCISILIDKLPPTYREAINLTEYEGLTQKEMGERLNLSVSGAKSRVQRGREKLKQMLLEYCHAELESVGIALNVEPCCRCCAVR